MPIDITSQFNQKSGLSLNIHDRKSTIIERDNIPDEDRGIGMECFVVETLTKYVLKNGISNSNWTPLIQHTNYYTSFVGIKMGLWYHSDIIEGSLSLNDDISTLGYINNDILTIIGGDNNFTIKYRYTEVSGHYVTTVSVGTNYADGLYSVSGGNGSGLQVNLITIDVVGVPTQKAYIHMVGSKNICPAGFRIPTYDDINILLQTTSNNVENYISTQTFGVLPNGINNDLFNGYLLGLMLPDNSFPDYFGEQFYLSMKREISTVTSVPFYVLSKIFNITDNTITDYISRSPYVNTIKCIMETPEIWKEGMQILDIDGNLYNTIKIGNQVWLNENLIVTRFNDGTPLTLNTHYYYPFNDKIYAYNLPNSLYNKLNANYIQPSTDQNFISQSVLANIPTRKGFGYLYNRAAIIDSRGFAPAGWHVPTIAEFNILISESIASGGAHTVMHPLTYPNEFGWGSGEMWIDDNITLNQDTNKLGLSLLPTGYFDSILLGENFECTLLASESSTYYYSLKNKSQSIELGQPDQMFPVRLLKDNSTDPGKVFLQGKWYPTIKIGNQVWLKENILFTKYNDNSLIRQVSGSDPNGLNVTGSYMLYNSSKYFSTGNPSDIITQYDIEKNLTGEVLTHTHPSTYFEFSIDAFEVEWVGDWIKLNLANYNFNTSNFDLRKTYVKDISIAVELGTGYVTLQGKARRPAIIPSGDPDHAPSYEFVGYYIKDIGNILTLETDFSRIIVRVLIVLDTTTIGYWGDSDYPLVKWNRPHVIFNENNIDMAHRTRLTTTFNWEYQILSSGSFPNSIFITAADPSLPQPNYDGRLDGEIITYYARTKEADLVMTALSIQNAFMEHSSNPDVFNIVAHKDNTATEYNYVYSPQSNIDSISSMHDFPKNTIMVGSGRLNDSDASWATSYGKGMEFIEATKQADMPGCTIWTDIHQQSPAVAIVGAKFKYIKNQTGVSWATVRLACRATATQSTYNIANNIKWDKYRGFGIINVAAAISWINALKSSSKAYLTDRYNEGMGYATYMNSIDDFSTETPLPKKLTVHTPQGNYVDNAAALAAGLSVGEYYHTDGILKMVI